MSACWYVMHTKPHKEEAVWHLIQAQGFGAYYPRLRVEPVNPRARKVRPYFPRYLFVQADLDEVGLSTFKWMPCAVGLLCYGDVPVPVPDDIIDGITRAVERCDGYHIYNLGESQPVSLTDLITLLEEALGRKAIIDRKPMQPGDVDRTYADVTLARKELGYQPSMDLKAGLAKFVEWFRGNAGCR